MTPASNRIVAAASIVAACVAITTGAEAHAFLRTARPAVGSTVATAPREVVIDFTEGVEPAFSAIAVTDGAGRRVDTGDPHRDGAPDRLAVALKTLAPGTYTVAWHATSVDTHRTEGRFTFTVGG